MMERPKGIYAQMREEQVRETFGEYLMRLASTPRPETRTLTLYTGAGGADLFQETFESELGYERVYINKPLRILRRLGPIRKSYSGRYFRVINKRQ